MSAGRPLLRRRREGPEPRLIQAAQGRRDLLRRHRTGVQVSLRFHTSELDEAVRQFLEWVESPASGLRQATVYSYRHRVGAFASKIGNVNLGDITSDQLPLSPRRSAKWASWQAVSASPISWARMPSQ